MKCCSNDMKQRHREVCSWSSQGKRKCLITLIGKSAVKTDFSSRPLAICSPGFVLSDAGVHALLVCCSPCCPLGSSGCLPSNPTFHWDRLPVCGAACDYSAPCVQGLYFSVIQHLLISHPVCCDLSVLWLFLLVHLPLLSFQHHSQTWWVWMQSYHRDLLERHSIACDPETTFRKLRVISLSWTFSHSPPLLARGSLGWFPSD